MSTVIGSNIVAQDQVVPLNSGFIGYTNYVNTSNISTANSDPSFPITNAANPATNFRWRANNSAGRVITIQNNGAIINYIGIARHNLVQEKIQVKIDFNGVTVRDFQPVFNQQSLLFLFEEASPNTIEIYIQDPSNINSSVGDPLEIAVIYCGLGIRLERNIYVGHTPITMGRDRTSINGVSQSGEYLGEIVTNQSLSTNVTLSNLTPDWYRTNLDPFFSRNPRAPCFWAWRPSKYPAEVGYCWVTGNPRPTNSRANGMMDVSWDLVGIA